MSTPVEPATPHYDAHGVTVHHGNCRDILPGLPDASTDAVTTDPPYELGFMGRAWDASGIAYDVAMWAECLRVLKPGGHLLAFGGTRTWHRLACAVEDAGFEIRDTITWLYGSGFPKSLDVSKAIDKAAGAEREVVGSRDITAPATDDAARWKGWGTALKPASEPIVVARKPLDGTVAATVLAHGTGALNIDACRVATSDDLNGGAYATAPNERHDGTENWRYKRGEAGEYRQPSGRWPSNVVLTHASDCQPVGTRKVRSASPAVPQPKFSREMPAGFGASDGRNGELSGGYADADGTETVEAWDCADSCPVAELDAQSGDRPPSARTAHRDYTTRRGTYSDGLDMEAGHTLGFTDEGGASRFFPTFRYEAKADATERPSYGKAGAGEGRVTNSGTTKVCRACGNKTIKPPNPAPACGHDDWERVPTATRSDRIAHPTVKPLDLMRWLVRLVTPPGGLVLDPFAGSGTTAEACLIEGFRCITIEREADYLPLIVHRITRRADPAANLTAQADRGEDVDLGLFGLLDDLGGVA